MTSQVAIVNRALTKLGATRIAALTDDSKEAQVMSVSFDILRDDELRRQRWSFAIKRAQLSADATPPLFDYSNRFLMPSDCLRILMVGEFWPGYDPTDYRTGPPGLGWGLEGRYIVMNADGPLNLVYIAQIADTTQWDACFVESFACRLAAETCEAITQSSTKRELAWNEYRNSIISARRAGAIEKPPQQIADDSWILGRLRA